MKKLWKNLNIYTIFFINIDKNKNNRQIKRMMEFKDTSKYLQLLMQEKDKSWKEYWNRLEEWKASDFEYWKTDDVDWMFYIAFGE